jgi:hypothetical protein
VNGILLVHFMKLYFGIFHDFLHGALRRIYGILK